MLLRLSPMRCSVLMVLIPQVIPNMYTIMQLSPSSRRRLCIMKITSLHSLPASLLPLWARMRLPLLLHGNALVNLWMIRISPRTVPALLVTRS